MEENINNLNISIEDFLPKYPNINKYINPMLNPYDDDFYQSIYRKKEFYELKLDKDIENIPKIPGELFKRQKIISRFLSSYTPYNALLLAHYMGSGKTCSAFGLTENIRENENSNIKGVIVLTRGKNLLNNLINELVFTCSKGGKYIPENFEQLTDLEKTYAIKRKLKDYYQFYKFYEFSQMLKDMTNDQINKVYSNHIIIIDEIHNIKKKENKKENIQNTYDELYRFLHNISNEKILLMTGTPMKDSPEEIAPIMNLILPEKDNLPTGNKFISKYLTKDMTVKLEMKDNLKKYFKGRVSYLSSIESNIEKKYIGTIEINDISTFTLDIDEMSSFQTDIYNDAFEKDTGKSKENPEENPEEKSKHSGELYTNSRQASLCVFPDGSYGSKAYKQMVRNKRIILPNDVINYINAETKEESLTKLHSLSSKYAKIIQYILNEPNKNTFIYCKFVEGSGAILFSLLLNYFGYSKTTGKETTKDKRYALFTHKTSSPKSISRIIDRFNQKDNMYGEYISIIIASKIAGEGLNLKNIQNIHIITPHWNYAEIAQAISRGIRSGSHQDLIEAGIKPIIKIYQHVSVPNIDILSIDEYMYSISANKDISIKSVERILKESSVDCALTYNVNYKPQFNDYSRECDYEKCKYSCDGIPDSDLDGLTVLDDSTWKLYYNTDSLDKIKKIIEELFTHKFYMSIDEIIDKIIEQMPDESLFDIITVLKIIINESEIIHNKYGEACYIKQFNNQYFLVRNISVEDNYFTSYYIKNILLRNPLPFDTILYKLKLKWLPVIFEQLIDSTDNDSVFRNLLSRFPIEIKENIIENVIEAKDKGITKNKNFQDKILEVYNYAIVKVGDTWVSKLLSPDLRCYGPDKIWTDCEEEIAQDIEEQKETTKNILEHNPYGYYGIFNPDKNIFKIRDITKPLDPKDLRKVYKGRVCKTLDKINLLKIVHKIKLNYPDDFYQNKTDKELKTLISKKKYGSVFGKDNKTRENMVRVLYWNTVNKPELCKSIQEWFTNNDMIITEEKKK